MYAELSNFIKAIRHPGGQRSEALRSPGTNQGNYELEHIYTYMFPLTFVEVLLA